MGVAQEGKTVLRKRKTSEDTRLARAHGLFNVIGGAWPIVSLRSFEWVFGRKHDTYLQKASGGLFLSAGVSQLMAEDSNEGIAHARRIGILAATTYLLIDLIYAPSGRIRRTYLLDALMEIGWLWAWLRPRRR